MAKALMVVRHVANSPTRAVLTLEAAPGAADAGEAHGTATIAVPLEEGETYDDVAEGDIVEVTVARSGARRGVFGVHAQGAALVAQARRIPNSTNDPNYKTPPEQKVPPPILPDGVVTEPRPSVVLEPLTDVPPTAGVATAGPTSVEDAPKVDENATRARNR